MTGPANSSDATREAQDDDSTGVEVMPNDVTITEMIEAALFAADRPMSDAKIAIIVGLGEESDGRARVAETIEKLNELYRESRRAFTIEAVAGGRRVLTRPDLNHVVEALRGARQPAKLSQAALETLAIIAYRQPILRAELEAIRGVSCGEVLRGLLDRRLVRITGRAELVGRPMLYGTSREFLQTFGLAGLEDLPRVADASPMRSAAAPTDTSSPNTSS